MNVEEKIMEMAQEEAYIICNSNQFHVVVDGSYMYSIDTLADMHYWTFYVIILF